jgi:hypothetical protein
MAKLIGPLFWNFVANAPKRNGRRKNEEKKVCMKERLKEETRKGRKRITEIRNVTSRKKEFLGCLWLKNEINVK